MADSNITKKALSLALKELMEEKTFEKIFVSDICEKCHMNRKSFYYHFKDKYDLVNWIFDTEFISVARQHKYVNIWSLMEDICQYLYSNKLFYRKAFSINGQNSFTDHFRQFLSNLVASSVQDMFGIEEIQKFQLNFFVDAFAAAFRRWIIEYTDMSPQEFIKQNKMCLKIISIGYEQIK